MQNVFEITFFPCVLLSISLEGIACFFASLCSMQTTRVESAFTNRFKICFRVINFLADSVFDMGSITAHAPGPWGPDCLQRGMRPDKASSLCWPASFGARLWVFFASFLLPPSLWSLNTVPKGYEKREFFTSEMELLWSVKDTSLLLVPLFTSAVL